MATRPTARRAALHPVAHARLHATGLATAPFVSPAEVVRTLGALQSQEHAMARWSIAQRLREPSAAAVDAAIADGAILRTHVLRPTWHFVHASDIRWMLALTAPRIHQSSAARYRELEVDAPTVRRTRRILERALGGGAHLTRAELAERLAAGGVPADGQRLGYLLMHAELEAVICGGRPKGAHHTYALVDERAPEARPLAGDEALAELAIRFFTSHGPATEADYRWWSGLTGALVKRGIAAAGAALARVEVDGRPYWRGAGAEPPAPVAGGPTAWLLQSFDEYVVAHPDSRDVLDPAGLVRYVGQRASRFLSVVLVDGRVAGFWGRTDRAAAVVVDVHLAATPTRAERAAIERAAAAYGRFVGRTTVVTVTETA